MKKELPVFLINGFLDSGKTSLIKEIIESDDVYQNNNTVVIVTEDGENGYSQEWLNRNKVKVIMALEEEKLKADFFDKIYKDYKPKQVFIELNAFMDFDSFTFPDYYVVYQQVTLFDATKFEVFFNNMKPLINSMVKYSTLIIFNRSDNVKNLGNFRRGLRAFNQQGQVAFETKDGKMSTMLDEDLPYDLNDETIRLKDKEYPIWYLDVFDNSPKYQNKTICFRAYVRDVTPDSIIVGRQIMTCCEADIQFYGYECITDEIVKNNSFIYLECEVIRSYSKIAKEEVVMLKAKHIETLPYEEEHYLTFN